MMRNHILWLVFVAPALSVAQDYAQYSGSFKVLDYHGSGNFNFKLAGKDTLFNGPFLFQHIDPQALLADKDVYFSIRGAFNDNVPDGAWDFSFGEFSAAGNATISDYQYHLQTSGVQHSASGYLEQGHPDGEWTHTVKQIKNSAVAATEFESIISFEKGVAQKSFQIQSGSNRLAGRFLREGLAHDVWELYTLSSTEASESWHFYEGKLEKILINQSDSVFTLPVYGKTQDGDSIINLDDRYLKIITLTLQPANDGRWSDGVISEILKINTDYYARIDTLLSAIANSRIQPQFRVKVPFYPLSQEETAQLDSIRKFHKVASSTSEQLLHNSQLMLLRFSDPEVLFRLTVLEALQKLHLKATGELTAYAEGNVLPFIPRQYLFDHLWPGGSPIARLEATYPVNDSLITRNFEDAGGLTTYSEDATGVEAMWQVAQYSYHSVKTIEKYLSERLRLVSRQQELVTLENELVNVSTKLEHVTDSLKKESPAELATTLTDLQSAAVHKLAAYSKMEDVFNKVSEAKKLILCLEQTINSSLSIAALPAQWDAIKEAYTVEVWNPFTATMMTDEVKKRITTAYHDILIPHYLNQLRDGSSCEKIVKTTQLLASAHQRMFDMRNEETSTLERRLKNEDNPESVQKIFNIQPRTNQ